MSDAAPLGAEAHPSQYGSVDSKPPPSAAPSFDVARRLAPLLTMLAFGIVEHGVVASSLVYISMSFFAGTDTDCHANPSSADCKRGASEFAYWRGTLGGISNTLALFSALALGRLSDSTGRRPLFRAKAALSLGPILALALHLFFGVTLWAYYLLDVLVAAFDVNGVFLAYVGDVIVEPHLRSSAFAVVILFFFCGGLPVLVLGLLPAKAAVILCLLASLGKVVYVEAFLHETRKQCSKEGATPFSALGVLVDGFRVLSRHSLITNMAAVVALSGFALAGMNIVTTPILTSYIGVNKSQGTLLAIVAGTSAFATVSMGLRPLTQRLGDVVALRLCLAATASFPLLLALCTRPWHVLSLNALLFGLLVLQFPIISAIKSNLVSGDEQGLVQGALASIRVLALGVADIFFGWFYRAATRGGTAPRSATLPLLLSLSALAVSALLMSLRLPAVLPPPPARALREPDADAAQPEAA